MEAKAAAVALLLSFSAALFLRGALAGLLLSALDGFVDGGGSLLDLIVSRRSMVLLCHAILLLVLRDAGILNGAPVRRKRHQPRRGSLPAEEVPVVARCTAPARAEEPDATKEIILVEKWTSDDHRHVHRADRGSVLSLERGASIAHGDERSMSDMGRAIVAYENGKSRGEGETEEGVDDDEMDRRFDKFIADTRRKMQLESLQPPSKAVSPSGKEMALA